MNKDKTLYKSAAWLGMSMIILKILGLLYKVPLSYMLGDEGMGYFNSAYTIYTFFFMICSAGIPKAIAILTSKYEAERNDSSSDIYNSIYGFFVFSGISMTFILLIFANKITRFLSASGSLFSLYSVAPSILFICASGVIRGYLAGRSSFSAIAISELISGGGKLVFGLAFAYIGYTLDFSLQIISALTILGVTIGSGFSFLYLKRKLKESNYLPHTKAKGTRKILIDILRISVPITLSSALVSVSSVIDLTLIMRGLNKAGYSHLVSTNLYGNYTTLALPLFTVVSTLIGAVCTAIIPSISAAYSQNNNLILRENISNGMRLAYFIAVPSAVMYFFFSKQILLTIFDETSATLGYAFLSALAPAILMLAALSIINSSLEACQKGNLVLISLTIGTIAKLLTTYLLMYRLDVGILASPIGTALSYGLSLIISFSFAKIYFKFDLISFGNLLKCVLISLVSLQLTFFLKNHMINISHLRLSSLLTLLFFGVFYIILSAILSKEWRLFITNYVKINKKN